MYDTSVSDTQANLTGGTTPFRYVFESGAYIKLDFVFDVGNGYAKGNSFLIVGIP